MRPIPAIPLLFATCLAWTACRQSPPTSPPAPDRRAAAEKVVNRLAGVKSLRAEVDVTLTAGGERTIVVGALAVEVPDRIRMRCWGPLGMTVMDLLVVGRTATLYLPRDGRALRVDVDRLALSREDLDPKLRALALIDGVMDELRTAGAEWRFDGSFHNQPVIEVLEDGEERTRIVYDPETLLPTRRFSYSGGTLLGEIRYRDYEEMGGLLWPAETTVISGDLKLVVRTKSLDVNPELDARVFEMALPDGVEIEER